MTSVFDVNASSFERYRALPSGVPEAVRRAIWESTRAQPSGRVLDLGAGSGRLGRTFVEAGDNYTGIDASLEMLREFSRRTAAAPVVQADGACLPFADGSFELVLLMQVLSGADNWRNLLCETARVILPGGFVVVGQTTGPTGGIDAQMKRELAIVLEELGIAAHGGDKSRKQALEWLSRNATRQLHIVATSWAAQRTPRDFLERHRSGARFSALPAPIQEQALKTLAAWAETRFKSLDKLFTEEHSFELEIFQICD